MITLSDPLPGDLETAHQLIRELLETLGQQIHLNEKLQHQLEQLLRQRYGKKSERIDPAQLLLFAQEVLAQAVPTTTPTPAPEPEPDPAPTPTPSDSKKKGHGRKPLPASLPRKPIIHDVPPEELTCPDCGTERTCIGHEVREQLEYVPASMIVLEHIRPKYACQTCEANVVIAERLPEPIEKGLPGPGLMAHIVVSKYADHLPLYRLEGIFKRFDVELSRSTMCDWMAVSADLLAPIVKLMLSRILTSKVVQNDDTPVPVQDHAGKGIKTGRLWASVGDHYNPYVVYCYTPDHSATGPHDLFKEFKGYLQADAYSGYDGLYKPNKIIEVGCMMHARRKLYEARTSDAARSHQALAWISLLYDVEREAKEREPTDYEAFVALRHELRAERSLPIFDKFHDWLAAELPKVLPKSPIAEAIQYALNHWVALKRPLEAGFLELDNGACERAFKPVAIGRNRSQELAVRRKRQGRSDGGRSDEPTHHVQESGDQPADLPTRCAGSNQHPSSAADRRAAARPLAGVAPGRRRRERLTVPRAPGPSSTETGSGPLRAPRGGVARAPDVVRGVRVRRARVRQDGAPHIIPRPLAVLKMRFTGRLHATSSVPGIFQYSSVVGAILGTVLKAGSDTLSVTFEPTDTADYMAVTKTVTIDVAQATPVIEWANPAAVVYGTALSPAQLDATASVPGTFTYSPAAGSIPGTGTDTLSVTFIPSDSTDYKKVSATVGQSVLTPTPTPTQRVIIGQQRLLSRKLKKGKPTGKAVLSGFTLGFDVALNAAAAANAANYQLDTITTKTVKKNKESILRPITNFAVSYLASSDAVEITLGGNETFPTGGQITVLGGLTTAAGGTLSGPAVFTISKGGKSVVPS